MAWKDFEYKDQWFGPYGKVSRPMLQITLKNGEKSFTPLALLDTGAGGTMINAEIASVLGIHLGPCDEVPVAGIGRSKGKVFEVEIEISGLGFNKKEVPAIFVENLPFPVLLGHQHFFPEFDVLFEASKQTFSVRKATAKKK